MEEKGKEEKGEEKGTVLFIFGRKGDGSLYF